MGIGLAKGGKNIRYNILAKISLAWVTAPILAFLISFTMLFIMQNVFELTVREKTHYIFDRLTVTEIVDDGFDSAALSTVNGRSFVSEREIYRELNEQDLLTRDEIVRIIEIAELYPLKIDAEELIKSGMHRGFSSAQMEVLQRYESRTFRHKWQLRSLLLQDPEFVYHEKPVSELQKNQNRITEGHLDQLYRSFRIEEDNRDL